MTEPQSFTQHMTRIVRHTLIYGLGFAGTSALMLLLTPLYTHFIGPEEYGRLRLVNISVEVLAIIGRLGVIEAFYRFFYHYAGKNRKREIMGAAMLTMTLPLIAVGVAMALFAEPLSTLVLDGPGHALLFLIAAGTLIASGVSTFGLAYLRVEERSGLYSLATLVQLGMALGLNVYFVAVADMGVMGILLASLISRVALSTLLLPWMWRAAAFRISIATVKDLLSFGIPLVPASVAAYLITNSSLYFLKGYGTLEDVGIYSLALQFGAAINLLVVTPFDMTWGPMKFKLANDPQADRIYSNVLTYFVVIALFAVIGLAALIGDLMALIINDRYHDAALYVGAIGLSYAVFGAYRVFCFGMDIRNKTHYRAAIIVASLGVTLLVNISAIPTLGAWGALIALLAGYAFMAASAYVVSQRLFPVSYQLDRIAKACAAAGLHFLLAYLVETGAAWSNLVVKGLIVVCYPATLYLIRFYSPEERAKLLAIWRKWRGLSTGGAP
jgi:O-antigen/teichoic acid export membrane protein